MDSDQLREKTLNLAYRLLAAKPRSEAELRARLLDKRWAEPTLMQETVDGVISRLKELRYVNDNLFAYDYARSRVGGKPIGKARVARDLARRKVSREVADEALGLVYEPKIEDGLIDQAIGRRLRIKGKPTTREETKKLFDHLLRLGFSYELVIRKVRAIGQVEAEINVED